MQEKYSQQKPLKLGTGNKSFTNTLPFKLTDYHAFFQTLMDFIILDNKIKRKKNPTTALVLSLFDRLHLKEDS